jgi:hypothetical protein
LCGTYESRKDKLLYSYILPGLAQNQSIQKLRIKDLNLLNRDLRNYLTQFFTDNRVIECLHVFECCRVSEEDLDICVRALASALRMCHSLSEFKINEDGGEWFCVGDILHSLTGHTNLETLSLSNVQIDHDHNALETILMTPTFRLKVLELHNIFMDDHVATGLANGISGNSTLKELGISSLCGMGDNGLQTIFDALQRSRFRLEKLHVADDYFSSHSLARSLANSLLHHIATLRCLNLSKLDGYYLAQVVGWDTLFRLLERANSALEELKLSGNEYLIGDEYQVGDLTDSLVNNNMLRILDLSNNGDVPGGSWADFSAILRNPNSALQELDLSGNSINDDTMFAFAENLASNKKLTKLNLGLHLTNQRYKVTPAGYAALSNILCNKTSILSTCHSNHTLKSIGHESNEELFPIDLINLLRINEVSNQNQAARIKIIKTHLCGPNINMQPFMVMEVSLRPHALACMGGVDNMYQLLRTMPSLLERFVHKDDGNGRKRKLDL